MIDVAVVLLVVLDRLPWIALVILLRDVLLVWGYRYVVPRGYEFEVSQLGKIATWGLYASLGLVLVTERDTWWPLACFWVSLAARGGRRGPVRRQGAARGAAMKAVVMAGGEGTRLRPLTSNQPKPMVPIVGKPCMEHIIDLLRRHGMDEVVVTLAFMPQAIRTYFGDGESLGVDIDYSVEEQPLGTAGSVRLAHERLDETFLVISGDALCDVDLGSLVEAHRAKGAAVTIGLKSVDNPLEFGIVVTDDDGRVERFLEKPSWGQVFSDTINTGIYVLEPEVLRHVPDDRPYDFSKELFPLLLEMGRPFYGHVLDGYWQDIGNLDQFRQANFDALDGHVQLEVPGLRLRGNVWVSEEVDIDEVEPVEGPAFVGPNCRIADGASIGPYSVLSQGVIVREGARVSRSVIDVGTYLGRNCVVEGAILGRGCDLRDHVRVHEGVAIGDQVTIGPEASIFPGVRVYPFKEIETGAQIHENVVWETRAASSPFGRDGATGLVNVDLTPETAVRLAAALGTALRRGDRVVASRDSADACRMIQRAIIAGLTSTGVHVADLRISPAAVTRHVLKTQAHAGRDPRRPLERRPRGDPGPRLRVAREPDDGAACRRRSRSTSAARSCAGRRSRRWGRRPTRRASARATPRTSSTCSTSRRSASDGSASRSTTATRRRRSRCRSSSARSASRRSARAARTPTTCAARARAARREPDRDRRAGRPRRRPRPRGASGCCSSTSAARPCARTWRSSSSSGCSSLAGRSGRIAVPVTTTESRRRARRGLGSSR